MAVTKFAKVEGFVFLCIFDIKNLFLELSLQKK